MHLLSNTITRIARLALAATLVVTAAVVAGSSQAASRAGARSYAQGVNSVRGSVRSDYLRSGNLRRGNLRWGGGIRGSSGARPVAAPDRGRGAR